MNIVLRRLRGFRYLIISGGLLWMCIARGWPLKMVAGRRLSKDGRGAEMAVGGGAYLRCTWATNYRQLTATSPASGA